MLAQVCHAVQHVRLAMLATQRARRPRHAHRRKLNRVLRSKFIGLVSSQTRRVKGDGVIKILAQNRKPLSGDIHRLGDLDQLRHSRLQD